MYVLYDNTFEGLLSAIFEVYDNKLLKACIRKEGIELPVLFGDFIQVTTDDLKAKRVFNKLQTLLGKEGVSILWKVWLSENTKVEDCILGTIRYAIEQQRNVLSDFGNLHVLQLNQQLKKINREKHRMEAFVRFQLTKDEIYFCTIEPDFNVLPLIVKHFQSRYADQRWLIYDLKRRYGIYYDLNTTEYITFGKQSELLLPGKDIFQENEQLYQVLWKNYFKNTNIASRKNMKLHVQHVPRRYWKYLTEKQMDESGL